jgi:hypothetical protein
VLRLGRLIGELDAQGPAVRDLNPRTGSGTPGTRMLRALAQPDHHDLPDDTKGHDDPIGSGDGRALAGMYFPFLSGDQHALSRAAFNPQSGEERSRGLTIIPSGS